MDARRFDAWTVAVSTVASRRSTVRALLAAITAGGLTVLRGEVAAACKKPGRKCKRHKQCCSKLCKGKQGKKRCRCKQVGASCPIGLAARCCGDPICGQNSCSQDGVCCVPLGAEGCTEACDCCTENPACQNGRCCLPNGAPDCENHEGDPNTSCCSGNCQNNSCVP
jgi:hypothetical protein